MIECGVDQNPPTNPPVYISYEEFSSCVKGFGHLGHNLRVTRIQVTF